MEITWADCELRKYLNGEFYDKFSEINKSRIIPVTNKNPDNPWYGAKGGEDTQDNIFLLTIEDVVCRCEVFVSENGEIVYLHPLSESDQYVFDWSKNTLEQKQYNDVKLVMFKKLIETASVIKETDGYVSPMAAVIVNSQGQKEYGYLLTHTNVVTMKDFSYKYG